MALDYDHPECILVSPMRWHDHRQGMGAHSGQLRGGLESKEPTSGHRNLRLVGSYAAYYTVDQIHVHCNFDKPLYHNDIALLHLSSPIEFNDVTTNITLADIDELQEGDKLTFAGWGSTEAMGTYGRYLQEASGTYLPVEPCQEKLQNYDDVDLGHVCVQMEAGKGACHGDTGGPLIDEHQRLVGIGNWGVPCGRGYPVSFRPISGSTICIYYPLFPLGCVCASRLL